MKISFCFLPALAVLSLITACSTSSPPATSTPGGGQAVSPASQIAGAATAPLNDLNLVRADKNVAFHGCALLLVNQVAHPRQAQGMRVVAHINDGNG